MKEMTVSDALKLVKSQPTPSISIYLGTDVDEKSGAGKIMNNLLRLLKTAESLALRTYDIKTRERLLGSLKKALVSMRLSRSKGGVAIYHSEKFTGVLKVPTNVSDLAVTSDSFHLKPVMRAAQLRRSYSMLVFKRKSVDLMLVTVDGAKRIERFSLHPANQDSKIDDSSEHRWFKDGLKIRRQKETKAAMESVLRQMEICLQGERYPLLLVGPRHYQDAFRSVCSYSGLLEQGLVGNVENIDIAALSGMSAPIMEPYFAEFDRRATERFRQAQASGLGSTNLKQIAEAAARGQVESLIIASDRHIWGQIDRSTGTVKVFQDQRHGASDDLLDDIAEMTLLKGGRVTVLTSFEMPENQPIAAVFRWSDSPQPILSKRALHHGPYAAQRRESRIEMSA